MGLLVGILVDFTVGKLVIGETSVGLLVDVVGMSVDATVGTLVTGCPVDISVGLLVASVVGPTVE